MRYCQNSRVGHIVVILAMKYYGGKCDYVGEVT